MSQEILTKSKIETKNDFKVHTLTFKEVNAYLLETNSQFLLIDTGYRTYRRQIRDKLLSFGVNKSNLRLIFLTHGDMDHSGNAQYFREYFKAPIAMHFDDIGMTRDGDFAWNRNVKRPIRFIGNLMMKLMRIKLKKDERFLPDYDLADYSELIQFGFTAKIYSLPGHSKGSVGLVFPNGSFFGGDLMENLSVPKRGSLIDNIEEHENSMKLIHDLPLKKIFPGHGEPFLSGDIPN